MRSLTGLVDLPVLGVVSAAFPRELSAKLRWELRRFLFAGAALCGALVVVLLLNWVGLRMPGVG